MTIDEILKEINEAKNIVILTHETPDGDAIGSCLGMKLALDKMDKEADIIMSKYANTYAFLPEAKTIKQESDIENYDLAISLDCATLKRLDNRKYFENAKKTIVIDHHGSNNMYGDINYVNPVSPACSEILLVLFTYAGIDIDVKIGTCLMTGIITDTGGLQYPATTADTFEYAAELLRKGVNIPEICKKTLQTKTKANFELSKRVMDRMELIEDDKIAFSYITNQDMEEVQAEEGDHEGLVNLGRNIEGVEVSIFIRQKDNEDAYKVSMRSGSYVNVSDVCLMFGGGGHPRAAGAVVQGNVEQVKEKLIKEVKKALNTGK